MKLRVILTIIAAVVASRATHAEDWPQFLGPQRNSTSPETGLLRYWPEKGPEVLWTVDLGRGYGGPAIVNGKVYLLDRDDEVGDKLRCFNLENGSELWSYAYGAPGSVMFPGSRSVPTVDGDRVYTCGHNGDLHCIDINSHQPVWKANIWTDFGGKPPAAEGGFRPGPSEAGSFPIWAITQNPLVYQDLLIVASQAPEAGIVAYDKLTGDIVTEYARTLIRVKAKQLARRPGFCRSDEEDVEQDLVLHLLSQAQHFDPQRGALNTFIARVVNSGVAMLVRDRTRIKRRPDDDVEVQSLEDKVEQPHGPPAPLWMVISLEDLQRRIGTKSLTDAEVFELADEVASAMASLPEELRDICESLQHRNRRETESELGLSRRKYNAAMTRIREHFSKSGLGKS